MNSNQCTVEDCERFQQARGWCKNHWARWRRTGDPLGVKRRTDWSRSRRDPSERFWEKVDKSDPSGCWIWVAGHFPTGYGNFMLPGPVNVYAHRFAYEDAVGPIPAGLTIDHLCFVRACVNPAHLEPVTRAENSRREGARRRLVGTT